MRLEGVTSKQEGGPGSGAAVAEPTGKVVWWGLNGPLGRACGWRERLLEG